MKYFRKILFAFFLLSALIVGQKIPNIEFDYAQFKVDSTHNLLEIYFQYELESLLQSTNFNEHSDNLKLLFELKDSLNQNIIQSDSVFIPATVSNSTKKSSAPAVALHKFIVTPGIYFLRISPGSKNSNIDLVAGEQILVSSFSTKQPVLSDIQLAYRIESAEGETIFNKNSLNIVPNPNASYSSDVPLLNYYVELYNMESKPLLLSTYIISQNMDVVYSKKKEINTKEKNIVDVGKINLLRYPSGIYTLQVILTDSTENYAFGSEKKFYLYNKLITQDVKKEQGLTDEHKISQFSLLSEEECNYAFDVSKYLANDQEISQYETLTSIESKQNFLQDFWEKRKGNNLSAYSAYEDYLSRVDEANKKFKKLSGLGYKSDMGRIYLAYGNPDRIERFPNESNLKPYEIWHYDNIEGGILFIFGDLTGFSEYELLHSTKRGEMYDENWRRRISIR